jgi:ATP-binding cassette, subfamily B, bacterial
VSTPPVSPRTTVRVAFRLLRTDVRAYAIAWVAWVAFYCFPIPIGLLLRDVLDQVTADGAGPSVWTLLAALAVVEVLRWAELVGAATQWAGSWVGWNTVPRVNLLRSLLTDPGPAAGRLPGSPGEAVSRFRDDTEAVALVLDVWLDISGALVSATVAVAILWTVDPVVTVTILIPVLVALLIGRLLGRPLRSWRAAYRDATAEVTSYLGDTFGAMLAIKAGGAEAAAGRRFRRINRARADRALSDQMGTAFVESLGGLTGEIGVGLVLLLVAPALRRGDFSVGDLGLFTTYLLVLARLPRWAGRLGAYHRQADVSVARLAELLPDDQRDPRRVMATTPTHLRHGPPPYLQVAAAATPAPFEALSVRGLTVDHGSGSGINGVDLDVGHGQLVVLTGPVGGGKTTLLRALLGLVPIDDGEIRWNGHLVEDPSVWMVPPRTAYVPQVPRLFSERLRDTILLGAPSDGLARALELARLHDDLATMTDGLDTMVGPRGVRLSGGQIQRTATARALVRRPQLLVVDDLSSALDVETEARLWDGLLGRGDLTALVVTHRPQVIERADTVVELDRGRLLV